MNIFEQAVRQKIRLDVSGSISIEQLYAARPGTTFIKELQDYEDALLTQLETLEKPSRRKNAKSEIRKELELKLSIVSGYLDEMEELKNKQLLEKEIKEKEQELLSLIHLKKQEITKAKSIEELTVELENLRK